MRQIFLLFDACNIKTDRIAHTIFKLFFPLKSFLFEISPKPCSKLLSPLTTCVMSSSFTPKRDMMDWTRSARFSAATLTSLSFICEKQPHKGRDADEQIEHIVLQMLKQRLLFQPRCYLFAGLTKHCQPLDSKSCLYFMKTGYMVVKRWWSDVKPFGQCSNGQSGKALLIDKFDGRFNNFFLV